jgi:AraC-like DNA-binding protein
VNVPVAPPRDLAALWEVARSGDLRSAVEGSREALRARVCPVDHQVELHLVSAFCAMRQGRHADARIDLEAAGAAAAALAPPALLRVDAWRAELAYFQGRYSDAETLVARLVPLLEAGGDRAYAAFVLRIRMAVLLARADYGAITALAERALQLATSSGDGYVRVQVLNVLGAAHFDRATSRLSEPHARAHLSAVDPAEAPADVAADAREALRYFEQARGVAEESGYAYAAWYVGGNIERLQILLGNARDAVPAIRKRLRLLQQRGARYDEIVTRSNLAWGLRTLGRHAEALHELDVALDMARATGTANVLMEFIEYDRSIVLDALGHATAARTSYRRYVQLVKAWNGAGPLAEAPPAAGKRPLEPCYLKRADRFIQEHLAERLTVAHVAARCGVSWRALDQLFADFRGITPVAHIRNMRLDHARKALEEAGVSVTEAARRSGFGSATTFALEFRKRFGIPPSAIRRVRGSARPPRDVLPRAGC